MVDKNIKKINISEIVPADYNPRKISEKDYENLKQSMDEFGVVSPIIINLSDNTIISGHQRFDVLYYENNLSELYLLELGDVGWVFPDTDLEIKDKDHEKALNIALNRIHGEFDEDKVQAVLQDLGELKLDHLTGFDLELDDIDYNFTSRIDFEPENSEDIDDDFLESEDELNDDFEEEIIEDYGIEYEEEEPIPPKPKTEKKTTERIRKGFVESGDIYRIGESSYLMFGKETNEQDRTKLLNCNNQKELPKIPPNLTKIKTITQEINYYISNDAELVENTIIANNNICKKIK